MLPTPQKTHAAAPPWNANAAPSTALGPDTYRWYLEGRLSKLVAQRFDMDNDEAFRFALACGGDPDAMAGHEPFDRHLRTVILRYGLTNLFRDVGRGPHHHAIKPTGYDDDADAIVPEAMAQWRATYRALPEPNQIIAATIIWLYRGGPDTVWLRRVAVAWPSADAVALLCASGALADWGLLIGLYVGW